MPDKYCTSSKCGAKTSYTIKPPKFCSSCGFEFSKAFILPPNASANQPIVSSPEPIKKIAPHKHRRPTQDIDDQLDDEDVPPDALEMDQARYRGRQLAASIRGDIVVQTGSRFGVRLGDFLQNPDKFADVGRRSYEQPNLPEVD